MAPLEGSGSRRELGPDLVVGVTCKGPPQGIHFYQLGHTSRSSHNSSKTRKTRNQVARNQAFKHRRLQQDIFTFKPQQ